MIVMVERGGGHHCHRGASAFTCLVGDVLTALLAELVVVGTAQEAASFLASPLACGGIQVAPYAVDGDDARAPETGVSVCVLRFPLRLSARCGGWGLCLGG